MEDHQIQLKETVLSWIDQYLPGDTEIQFELFVMIWLVLFAVLLHFFLHKIVLGLAKKIAINTSQQWQRLLGENQLFRRLSFVLQGALVQIQANLWLDDSSLILRVIKILTDQWILLFGLLSFFSLLDFLQNLATARRNQIRFPLRGVIQTIKLVACVFIAILAISLLMGKSPLILLGSLGALSAVLMLIFKDPILGLVAGIQLSVNEMLAIGDWLEMPKYGADGDVTDIGLTTVKVQNWDKTITTVPTYALISDSFKNWRGMEKAGGRRIKRSLFIDTGSIQFLNEDDIKRLKKAALLGDYLDEKLLAIKNANSKGEVDMSVQMNGRRLTNIGTFRKYVLAYLKAHPGIHNDMTLIVRQLEPSNDGLPIQVYAFTTTTKWSFYEDIQSDIFDHLFAILPEFGLRAHESPTGHDVRALAEKSWGIDEEKLRRS